MPVFAENVVVLKDEAPVEVLTVNPDLISVIVLVTLLYPGADAVNCTVPVSVSAWT